MSNKSDVNPRKRLHVDDDKDEIVTGEDRNELPTNSFYPDHLFATGTGRPNIVIHHTVHCDQAVVNGQNHKDHPQTAVFLDTPRLFTRDNRASPLRGKRQIQDLNIYHHQQENVCAVVQRHYSCQHYHNKVYSLFQKYPIPPQISSTGSYDCRPWFCFLSADTAFAIPYAEEISSWSEAMVQAVKNLKATMPPKYIEWNTDAPLLWPYCDFFHHQQEFDTHARLLNANDNANLSAIFDYIATSQHDDFQAARSLFANGQVSKRHFGKLFRKGDLVVGPGGDVLQAYEISDITERGNTIILNSSSWAYDGRFYKVPHTISLQWPKGREIITFADLGAWPLRLDSGSIGAELHRRGQTFWSIRTGKLVQYDTPIGDTFELRTSNPKYMVDMAAYRDLHQGEDAASVRPNKEYLETEAMNRSLQVSRIREVTWNKEAFGRLVLKSEKRELIEALVTIHLDKSAPSDVVDNKGAGLIMLLHGPPGTGKTLTAESVAELAEKPLYRITCGDIGTEAESVERYLESALYIGTMWSCVVLLDEADVFLEERTQTDLKRNALVSVFLRVLEYYDGILILTSNRIGTFDEAFKSRMQLAVHYPVLDKADRRVIWQDFIQTLHQAGIDIDKRGLEREIDKLAEHQFNGRQIRNIIKTGRQLAAFRNREALQVKHLDHVIGIANDFESYIVKTRGLTDEQWASQNMMRAGNY